jgi:hypothetical protein
MTWTKNSCIPLRWVKRRNRPAYTPYSAKNFSLSIAEVALPFAIIVDLNAVLRLANATLLQDGVRHLLTLHCLHELGGQTEAVFEPGQHQGEEGDVPLG